jgi:Family of unknown function (DUF6510)
MKGSDDEFRLDGNAAAGLLSEVFAFDITTATTTCDGCGNSSPVGGLALYDLELGAVLRCPACDDVMMCVTRPDGVLWLDLRGVRVLRTPSSG